MLITFRAFAWLRWRLLVNSFERTGSRDTLERLSLAMEKLGPLVAGLFLIPSALALGAAGIFAGHALATQPPPPGVFQVGRFVLLVLFGMAIFGPIILPSADRTNPVRLLLLPIPRRTLYFSQAAGAFGDPWLLLGLPLLAGVPMGLAAGGAITAAAVAAIGGGLLAIVLAGLSALTSTVVHMVSRDRRRGEILALVFVVFVPMIALLPSLMEGSRRENGEPRVRLTERMARMPPWVGATLETAARAIPSEMHLRAVRRGVAGDPGAAVMPLTGLGLTALLLHGVGLALFLRLLDGPASTQTRRAGGMREFWAGPLPGLSPGAAAVALAHVRLVLRTPRGRAVLLSPLAMFALFAILMWAGGGSMRFGPIRVATGLALATFATAVALLSILPIAMNQFAVDRSGLTMVLLSPLRERDYLAGKAAGNFLVTALPVSLTILVSLALFPGGHAGTWLALLIGMVAAWLIVAPLAAVLSAIFPRAVDLTSVGRGSNAHGAAGILGMAAFGLSALPAVLAVVAANQWFDRPALAPLLAAAWLVVALGLNRLLMALAVRVFLRRRENLAMLMR
jgi:hypothetical protein